ncbi:MAG: nitroreductase family protein [Candidatus Thermoplasmatota archaeon]
MIGEMEDIVMDVYRAIKERRSIRRYKDEDVPLDVLEKCLNAARLSPTGANLQPLKYMTVTQNLEKIFGCTNWAGYLDWNPSKEEMPRAYIAILKEEDTGQDLDVGIAAQSICVTAKSEGLGTCILGALDVERLEEMLQVPEDYELKLMVALGYPDERPEVVEDSEKVEYYLEEDELKVPKKPLEEVWIQR